MLRTILLVIAFVTACIHTPTQATVTSKKIVFIRSNLKPEPGSAMVDQFKATLQKRGYVAGKNIEYVDTQLTGLSETTMREAMEAADRHLGNADLLVSAGGITLPLHAKLAKKDIPQLFAPVLREEALEMLPSLTQAPGTNLSGVYLNYPPEKILRLTRLVLPDIGVYAFIYDSRIHSDLLIKNSFEQLPETERHGITVHYLDLAAGTDQILPQMKALRVEAFGGMIGAYKNREILANSGLPMITALLMDIGEHEVAERIQEGEILAGLFAPMNFCGEQAGEMAADLLDGKKTLAQTVPRPTRQVAFVNMETAERLKIAIPFAVLEAVDFVIK